MKFSMPVPAPIEDDSKFVGLSWLDPLRRWSWHGARSGAETEESAGRPRLGFWIRWVAVSKLMIGATLATASAAARTRTSKSTSPPTWRASPASSLRTSFFPVALSMNGFVVL